MKKRKVGQFIVFGLLSLVFVVFLGQQVFAQNNVPNISGQWTYRALDFGPECVVNEGNPSESTVTINQTGNRFTSSGGISFSGGRRPQPSYEAIGNGTFIDGKIQSNNRENYISWSGSLMIGGNVIGGTATCVMGGGGTGRGSLQFTLAKRSPSNQNQPNNTTPATPQPSPNQTNRQPVTTPPSSTQTPSNSPAPPFPQEAGPNIIRPDFR